MPFAILTPTGHIREVVRKLSPFMALVEGERIAAHDPPDVDPIEFTLTAIEPVDGDAVEFEVTPIPGALERVKAAKNEAINAARLVANTSTFNFNGKLIAVDTLSRSDIDGAHGYITATNSMPPGWPGGWKAEDNTIVPINTVAEWIVFYSAMVTSGTANFAHAQALKAQMANLSTAEQVKALPDW